MSITPLDAVADSGGGMEDDPFWFIFPLSVGTFAPGFFPAVN